jgi:hypothetical protein
MATGCGVVEVLRAEHLLMSWLFGQLSHPDETILSSDRFEEEVTLVRRRCLTFTDSDRMSP